MLQIKIKISLAQTRNNGIKQYEFSHSELAALQGPADGESTVAAARSHAVSGTLPGTQGDKLLSGKLMISISWNVKI